MNNKNIQTVYCTETKLNKITNSIMEIINDNDCFLTILIEDLKPYENNKVEYTTNICKYDLISMLSVLLQTLKQEEQNQTTEHTTNTHSN